MRHTILILFTGLLLTLTVSCDNWLERAPADGSQGGR